MRTEEHQGGSGQHIHQRYQDARRGGHRQASAHCRQPEADPAHNAARHRQREGARGDQEDGEQFEVTRRRSHQRHRSGQSGDKGQDQHNRELQRPAGAAHARTGGSNL